MPHNRYREDKTGPGMLPFSGITKSLALTPGKVKIVTHDHPGCPDR